MCGIAGFHASEHADREAAVRRMLDAMAYRGPDGRGIEHAGRFSFGHLRLAIIDPEPSGHQPMRSACGRYLLTYNGELYNFSELRERVDAERAVRWRGHSDTEVLLEALALWGVRATLERANGMFAFAFLDTRESRLVLARDRFGEKPLCYAETPGGIAFASEIKALEAMGDLALSIDRDAVAAQLHSKYVPAPRSIYRETRKLAPGSWLEWRAGEGTRIERYFSATARALECRRDPIRDGGEAVDALEAVLHASVERRMVSDVPLGAFLSGGIDSSAVVALMQRASATPVKTFSIGFDVEGFNEADHARAVAAHLGTEHHERIVTADDALGVVPSLGAMFDEPFADSSQIPMALLARMTREQVTVSLSGDGGDELFCGYPRYAGTDRMWRVSGKVPMRRTVGATLGRLPLPLLDVLFRPARPIVDRYTGPGRTGAKIARLASWMGADSIEEFYRLSIGATERAHPLVPGSSTSPVALSELPDDVSNIERLMLDDTGRYLPEDILVKVDRTTMAVSLEGRMPMLDPAVFDLAWRLPMAHKHAPSGGKWALREVLYRHVPRALIDRPKMGFGAPVGAWLRGALREWASDLLSVSRLEAQGLYDARAVHRQFVDLLEKRHDRPDDLWNVLMVQAWLDADPARAGRITADGPAGGVDRAA